MSSATHHAGRKEQWLGDQTSGWMFTTITGHSGSFKPLSLFKGPGYSTPGFLSEQPNEGQIGKHVTFPLQQHCKGFLPCPGHDRMWDIPHHRASFKTASLGQLKR